MGSNRQHQYEDNKFPARRKILDRYYRVLDVRQEDFRNCNSVQDEFMVLLRKSGDKKASCQPTEPGFAHRIREINTAHQNLKELYDDGVIESFSEIFVQQQGEGGEAKKSNSADHEDSDDESSYYAELSEHSN